MNILIEFLSQWFRSTQKTSNHINYLWHYLEGQENVIQNINLQALKNVGNAAYIAHNNRDYVNMWH